MIFLLCTCSKNGLFSEDPTSESGTISIIFSDSFTILGLWVLGLAVSNINESQLQTYES